MSDLARRLRWIEGGHVYLRPEDVALFAEAADEIERLRARLECDHYYVCEKEGEGLKRVEGDPGYDGIDARDATIKLQDERIKKLEEQLSAYAKERDCE